MGTSVFHQAIHKTSYALLNIQNIIIPLIKYKRKIKQPAMLV